VHRPCGRNSQITAWCRTQRATADSRGDWLTHGWQVDGRDGGKEEKGKGKWEGEEWRGKRRCAVGIFNYFRLWMWVTALIAVAYICLYDDSVHDVWRLSQRISCWTEIVCHPVLLRLHVTTLTSRNGCNQGDDRRHDFCLTWRTCSLQAPVLLYVYVGPTLF